MECIVPCREQITDRFPVASFAVHVPAGRSFEVACATDPRLLHGRFMARRTPQNFFSSRYAGYLRAPRGETVWFLPTDQLRRFAGARRIYYALATYGGGRDGDPHFSINPNALDAVPSIELSPDFTGRLLNRIGGDVPPAGFDAYGGSESQVPLRWGGDEALEREVAAASASSRMTKLFASDDDTCPSDAATEPDPAYSVAPASVKSYDDQAVESYDADVASDPAYAGSASSTDQLQKRLAEAPAFVGKGAGDTHDDGNDEGDDIVPPSLSDDAPIATASAEDEDDDENTAAVYGAVEPATATLADAAEEPGGRDPEYVEGWDDEQVARAAVLETRPLDAEAKIRILRVVARAESGAAGYQAINADSEFRNPRHPAYQRYHIGLSWGFVQFTQRSGALGRVLQVIKRRESELGSNLLAQHRGRELFGDQWLTLVDVTTARTPDQRLAAVDGHLLWEGPWPDRFRAAGAVPHVTYAQNEVAVQDYFDSLLGVAAALRFDTARALALLVDRSIHMGPAGGLRWILMQVSPLHNEDAVGPALRALGHPDLATFQRSTGVLTPSGRWNTRTHAYLLGALMRLDAASPFDVPDRDAMLRRIGNAAASTGFARRVRALLENEVDFDDAVSFTLA